MKKASIYPLSLLLAVTIAISAFTTVGATSTVSVYIMDPNNPANGGEGLQSSGYWVGQIPIQITGGSTVFQTLGYCMNFDLSINIGGTYSANLAAATDSAEWRAVSYLLTWNNPATNNEAAASQVAVWRLLNQTRGTNYFRESWLSIDIDNAGSALATAAWGKDVVRQGDIFTWVSPITANMSTTQAIPGQTVTFIAQLTDSVGAPRANVKVLFNATLNTGSQSTLLNSTYVSAASTYTDNQGHAQVSVRVPSDTALGATIAVEGATQSIWPQRYIDVTNPSTQDLIGVGDTFQLTLSTNVCLLGFITVLPESPIGPIAAIGAFGAGFVVWTKMKKKAVKE